MASWHEPDRLPAVVGLLNTLTAEELQAVFRVLRLTEEAGEASAAAVALLGTGPLSEEARKAVAQLLAEELRTVRSPCAAPTPP